MIEPKLSENQRRIFDLRYSLKDSEGNPLETPGDAIKRVSENVAIGTILYGKKTAVGSATYNGSFPLQTAMRQYNYMAEDDWPQLAFLFVANEKAWKRQTKRYAEELLLPLKFVPNSPTWTGAGTPLSQYAACFVLPISDDLGRERDSIFETMKVAALIQQTGGGNGFDFSDLRPKDALIGRSMGKSSGPVSFLTVYDKAFGAVQQGGTRRGANMGILRCDHPDILQFIDAKLVEGEISNFNISVAMTDEFMEAICQGEDVLIPLDFNGKNYGYIKPLGLFERLTTGAWTLGDPGVFFVDAANRQNPCPTRYKLAATNPCGEQALPPYSNCCLGSIAVNKFVKDKAFDWADFEKTIHLSVQFLDDVVDANRYVPEIPELEQAAMNERRIGLGVMGVADALFAMDLAYDDEDGLCFVDQMMEFFRFHTMLASIERAKERGPFPWISSSIYDPEWLREAGEGGIGRVNAREIKLWERPVSILPIIGIDPTAYNFGRPEILWDSIYTSLCANGIRNACQTTVAPTGTISNFAGLEGSGIEPAFALSYTRTVMQEEENIHLQYLSGAFENALREYLNYTPTAIEAITALVALDGGSCQGVGNVPTALQRVFKVAGDIDPKHHVYMQAVCQAYVDNAISKTINMPYESTVEDVAEIYKLAWSLGCKGITVYRQGSRELEVLTTTKSNNLKLELVMGQTIAEDQWPVLHPMSMPEYTSSSFDGYPKGLPARVFEVPTPFGNMQVTITELRSHPGRPFDVRLQIGKAGNDKHADVEAIGRMASVALRLGVDVGELVDQLEGIGGKTTAGFGPNKVKSVADGLGKLFRSLYMAAGDVEAPETEVDLVYVEDTGQEPNWHPYAICPDCKNASVVMEAGCSHCDTRLGGCGVYSACD